MKSSFLLIPAFILILLPPTKLRKLLIKVWKSWHQSQFMFTAVGISIRSYSSLNKKYWQFQMESACINLIHNSWHIGSFNTSNYHFTIFPSKSVYFFRASETSVNLWLLILSGTCARVRWEWEKFCFDFWTSKFCFHFSMEF